MTKLLLLIFAFYVLPIIGTYMFIRKEYYHPYGRFYGYEGHPSLFDVIMIFIPLWNLIIAIDYLILGWANVKNDYFLTIRFYNWTRKFLIKTLSPKSFFKPNKEIKLK